MSNKWIILASFWYNIIKILFTPSGVICYDGDVRLINGTQPFEGQVEVCLNEMWRTVWGYISVYGEWNISEANVVCKQLGYSEACKDLL